MSSVRRRPRRRRRPVGEKERNRRVSFEIEATQFERSWTHGGVDEENSGVDEDESESGPDPMDAWGGNGERFSSAKGETKRERERRNTREHTRSTGPERIEEGGKGVSESFSKEQINTVGMTTHQAYLEVGKKGGKSQTQRKKERSRKSKATKLDSPEDTQRESEGSDARPVESRFGLSLSGGRFEAGFLVEPLLEEVET